METIQNTHNDMQSWNTLKQLAFHGNFNYVTAMINTGFGDVRDPSFLLSFSAQLRRIERPILSQAVPA